MCNEFKTSHKVISPLLFDFEARELLGIDLQQMYVDGRTDNTFDITSAQYKAYEEVRKARGYQKKRIDVINMFKQYFESTNDEKDFVKSVDISE